MTNNKQLKWLKSSLDKHKYMRSYFLWSACLFFLFVQCQSDSTPTKVPTKNESNNIVKDTPLSSLEAKKVRMKPVINGIGNDFCWKETEWHPINQLWEGKPFSSTDFSGRYKLAWSEEHLYILAEITDDIIYDAHPDGLTHYWEDDCLEIFIDEDRSKGNHQYNYNAFAYHIGLDLKVVDTGPDSLPHYYNDHIQSFRTIQGKSSTWEMALSLYDDNYQDHAINTPVILTTQKTVGFAIAYCDNDRSSKRAHFIGSVPIAGEDKNRAWIDAGLFGEVKLIE